MIDRWSGELLDRGDHLVVRMPDEPDYWMGNAIVVAPPPAGAAVAPWLAHWRAVFEATFPDAAHRCLRIDGELGAADLGADWDLQHDTALVQHAPPAAAAPDGVVLRPLEHDDDWARLEQLTYANEATYPVDEVYRAYVRGRLAQRRRWLAAGRGAWWGGFAGPELIAALGLVWEERLARYQDVMTAEAWRRRGVASALLAAAGREAPTPSSSSRWRRLRCGSIRRWGSRRRRGTPG